MNHICYFYILKYRSIHNVGISLDARYLYVADEQQKKIMELSENSNLSIYRVDNKNKKIIINQKWFEYIKNNEKDIDQWIWYNILEFAIRKVTSNKNKV